MPALDHRIARGHAPFIAARSTQDEYSRMLMIRSRSPSPSRGDDELLLRGQAAKTGKSSAIVVALMGIAHTMERRSLDLRLDVRGSSHPNTVRFMVDISDSWYCRGLYTEAEALRTRIVDVEQERNGPMHPNTLQAMEKLGVIWIRQGKYSESESIASHVVHGREQALGELHHDTLSALLNLSISWNRQRRYEEAEAAQRRIIHIREITLGAEHPETIEGLHHLADTLFKTSRLEEAETAQVQVLEAKRRVAGDKHPGTIHAMSNVASTWYKQGRLQEAETMKTEVLRLRREVLGSNHPDTLWTMNHLAVIRHRLGRLNEAEALMSETVERRAKVLGSDSNLTNYSAGILRRWRREREERLRDGRVKVWVCLRTWRRDRERQEYRGRLLEARAQLLDRLRSEGRKRLQARVDAETPNIRHADSLPDEIAASTITAGEALNSQQSRDEASSAWTTDVEDSDAHTLSKGRKNRSSDDGSRKPATPRAGREGKMRIGWRRVCVKQ